MQHVKIGLRTLKTAISVAICIIICYFISRDTPVLACLASVYCLRTDPTSSIDFSKHRILGTFMGVIVSMGCIFLQQTFPRSWYWDAIIAFIGVVCTIVLCNLTRHSQGILTAVATFLIICFNTSSTESLEYAFFRLFDVVIGACVAISVDYLLPAKKK